MEDIAINENEFNELEAPIKSRGRPAKAKASPARERITGMPIEGRELKGGRRINSKPQREVESLSRGGHQALDNRKDASHNYTGFHFPPVVTKRFEREGYKLSFFRYGSEVRDNIELQQHIQIGWRPVPINEVPEVALNIIEGLSGLYTDESKKFFIYGGQILMKIRIVDWEAANLLTRRRNEMHAKKVRGHINQHDKRRGVKARQDVYNPEDDDDDDEDLKEMGGEFMGH